MLMCVLLATFFVMPSIAEESEDISLGLIRKKTILEANPLAFQILMPATPTIEMVWQNGSYTFIDLDGNQVHTMLPRVATVMPRARELILEEYVALSENGNYYERLYATRSQTDFRFSSYETSAWAKTNGYTITQEKTAGWTHSGTLDLYSKQYVIAHYSLSYSITTSTSIGFTVVADENQFSKLGFFVKYDHCFDAYQTYLERNGEIIRNEWEYGTTDTPNDYLYMPVYNDNIVVE